MPQNTKPKTDLLSKVLTQFKVNCEVIHQLKNMLEVYEASDPPLRYSIPEKTSNAEFAFLPDYTLLFTHDTLSAFYCHPTNRVYDISNLVNKRQSMYYDKLLCNETGATEILVFRHI